MIRIGTGKTLRRLDEMLTDAMNGTFEESRYDESELSRLESRWKQYFTTSKMSMEQTKKERESIWPMLAACPFLILFGIVVPYLAYAPQRKNSLVEEIRKNE